jgi:TetR/AcrR family transcriptional regulator, regulator of autoinduction and epiphytic fitness
MDQMVSAVKPDKVIGVRKARAKETRRRMLAAAQKLFASRGYVATTMAAIAEEASVAVQTVHFTFHTKADLLQELIRVVSAGEDDPKPVMDRAWVQEALAATDPQRSLALMAEHGTEIFRRMAPLRNAIESAASVDQDVAALWRSIGVARRGGMKRIFTAIDAKGQLRPRLGPDRATDIASVIHSHEAFLALTVVGGWSVEEYKAWSYLTLCDQLLADRRGNRRPARRASAAGFSFQGLLSPTQRG